jgi:type VI secretion system protein ImpG
MSDDLYHYYGRELTFLRQSAQEFAEQYPAAAGRLLLDPNRSLDPHVERLLEGFALLAGRVHQKLDDEFPELTESTMGVLYPHYLAPVPSMSIIQFELDHERGQFPDGFTIPRGSKLHTNPVSDVACRFQTCYPVTTWPVEVVDAKWLTPPFPPGFPPAPSGTAATLRLRLGSKGKLDFSKLASLDRLRFHLFGDASMIGTLYEALFTRTLGVALQNPKGGQPIFLEPEESLEQVGFGRDDGLLPYPGQSFLGYRLLTEFFAFPSKFLFVDLLGLDRLRDGGFADRLDIVLFLSRTAANLEQGVSAGTFRLGCTPVVNLFARTAEPIPLNQTRSEYRIVPDVATPHGMEVFSVDSVIGIDPVTRASTDYLPFYSFRHGTSPGNSRAFWQSTRRPSTRKDDRGTEVFLRLVDLDAHPSLPGESTLVVHATCTNRDLPGRLHLAGDRLAFVLESAAPLSKIRCLRLPTAPVRPPSRRGLQWRLISHLCLNHLSIADDSLGRQALQELLRIYDPYEHGSTEASSAVNLQAIEGIASVSSRRVVGWIDAPEASGFCRGVEVTIEFDEKKYVGVGAFLFASVLERFLGLYVSINSFCRLVARTQTAEEPIKSWPPRAGEQPIV